MVDGVTNTGDFLIFIYISGLCSLLNDHDYVSQEKKCVFCDKQLSQNVQYLKSVNTLKPTFIEKIKTSCSLPVVKDKVR